MRRTKPQGEVGRWPHTDVTSTGWPLSSSSLACSLFVALRRDKNFNIRDIVAVKGMQRFRCHHSEGRVYP
jgi:hypothetical protein